MESQISFPYTAIVGQEDFKLALELNLVDRSIGGVLALGDKGAGKTTTVRSLSQLISREGDLFNFVNLPIGASEDRVLGSVDLEKLINEKKQVLQKGLLNQAHGGILYIDEINLLNDYLTDILLDAAATGGYYLEREGFSLWQESKFCLVGTMNPEEGELRPQLTDRFGLCIDIQTPTDLAVRKVITQRRSQFDQDAKNFYNQFLKKEEECRLRIYNAKKGLSDIALDDDLYEYASNLSLEYGVEGMRADILLIKAGKAFAALQEKNEMTSEDIDQVAPLVLRHRAENPPESKNNEQGNGEGDQLQEPPEKENQSQTPSPKEGGNENKMADQNYPGNQQHFNKQTIQHQLKFTIKNINKAHRKGIIIGSNTQKIKQGAANKPLPLVNPEQSVKNYLVKDRFEVVYKKSQEKSKLAIYFLVDSSGSMAKHQQISLIKGVVSNTIAQNKGKQIEFAGVGLVKGSAEIIQMGTTSSEHIIHQLDNFPTGGRTNLTQGFQKINYLLKGRNSKSRYYHLFILTDGRINASNNEFADPMEEAVTYYRRYLRQINTVSVIDTEKGFVKMAQAAELAKKLKARYQTL